MLNCLCASLLGISRQPGQLQGEKQPLLSTVCGSLRPGSATGFCAKAGSPTGAAGLRSQQ